MTPAAANSFLGGTPGASSDGRGAFTHSATTPFVEQVVVGKRQQIIQVLVAWFCEGHVLLEDVPGVAKTMMARAFARSVGCTFRRIQCTPDLLPTDGSGGAGFTQNAS